MDDDIHAMAIDSTGLKRFGRGEWHQEKYELSSKASWRKLHLAINQDHYIETCILTDRFSHDDQQIRPLLEQIDTNRPFSGDGAYDETPVYAAVIEHSPNADVVIPPRSNAVENDKSAPQRNRNIIEIEMNGRMQWQKSRSTVGEIIRNWECSVTNELLVIRCMHGTFLANSRKP